MYIYRPDESFLGLFRTVGPGGKVKNIGLSNVDITGAGMVGGLISSNYGYVKNSYATGKFEGKGNVGGLIALNGGEVSNSHVIGSLYVHSDYVHSGACGGLIGVNRPRAFEYGANVTECFAIVSVTSENVTNIGGLIGYAGERGKISDSYAVGDVEGMYPVGGLVGRNEGEVLYSYATGNVVGSGEDSDGVGGLIGSNLGDVIHSYATGCVTGTEWNVGGLIGWNSHSGYIANSNAAGNVTGEWNHVGGLVGWNSGTVEGSFAKGDVIAGSKKFQSYYTGGLIGANTDGFVLNAYATGNVEGAVAVGGLVGWNDGEVELSYSVGNVEGVSAVGGLVGWNQLTVTDSFYDRQASGQNDTGKGTPKTTAEMKTLATFANAGWDIHESETDLNNGYPYLSWQAGNSPVWYIAKTSLSQTLTVKSQNPSSGVNIAVWPADKDGRGNGATGFTRRYPHNRIVELHAPLAAGGNEFSHWMVDGRFHSFERNIRVGMDRSLEMTAVYRTVRVLTVKSQNPASGVLVSVWPADRSLRFGGSTEFTRKYSDNRMVELHASLTAGENVFSHWLVDNRFHSFERNIRIGMDRNKGMTAVYRTQRLLTVSSRNPSGGVGVAVWPADNDGLRNGTTAFTRKYDNNRLVDLHAPLAAGGNEFSHWEVNGRFHSFERHVKVGMTSSFEMTAVYRGGRQLTVSSQNPSSGVFVAVWPADNDGLRNGTTKFTRIYPDNRLVELHAPSVSGSNAFSHWLVGDRFHSFERNIRVGMDRSKEMTAVYRP